MTRFFKSLVLGCGITALAQYVHATPMTGSTTIAKAYAKTGGAAAGPVTATATFGGGPPANGIVGDTVIDPGVSATSTSTPPPGSLSVATEALVPIAISSPANVVGQVVEPTAVPVPPMPVDPVPAYVPVPTSITPSVDAPDQFAPVMTLEQPPTPTVEIATPAASSSSSIPEVTVPIPTDTPGLAASSVPLSAPSAPLPAASMTTPNVSVVPASQTIDAVANIDPSKRGTAKTVVKTTSGDAKIKAKAYGRNTPHGTVTKTKVKVRGELPPGVTVNAIANVGNTTAAKSTTEKNDAASAPGVSANANVDGGRGKAKAVVKTKNGGDKAAAAAVAKSH